MRNPNPIAILCSDLHLTLAQPPCRADKDWMETQKNYLNQLSIHAKRFGCPVVCAGDIFDRWNPPPELIHFALRHLPDGILCVPGQHDLPNHRIEDMRRSGYGVLAEAGKIVDLSHPMNTRREMADFVAYGAGWGQVLVEPRKADKVNLAVVHRYIWINEHKFDGAPDSANVSKLRKELTGYDAAVFGDNHKGFLTKVGDCNVLNSGGFIRRKSDEIDYTPSVGVLLEDGVIKRLRLDTTQDLFREVKEGRQEVAIDMKAFIDKLEELGEQGLNFRDAVERHLRSDDIEPAVAEIIRKAIHENE